LVKETLDVNLRSLVQALAAQLNLYLMQGLGFAKGGDGGAEEGLGGADHLAVVLQLVVDAPSGERVRGERVWALLYGL